MQLFSYDNNVSHDIGWNRSRDDRVLRSKDAMIAEGGNLFTTEDAEQTRESAQYEYICRGTDNSLQSGDPGYRFSDEE